MSSSNEQAMTAPGSEPVDPLPSAEEQDDPNVTMITVDGRHLVHGERS